MTLKRRARHARFSTRGLDSNRRAGRRRRRHEVQIDWTSQTTALDENFGEAAAQARKHFFGALEKAEAGNESVDGVHSDEAPKA